MKKKYNKTQFASLVGIFIVCIASMTFGTLGALASHPSFVRSNDTVYKVMFIGKLNTDCYDDTVIASVAKSAKIAWRGTPMLPKYILWGKSLIVEDTTCKDTVGGIIADSHKVIYSIIQYPTFVGLRGTVSFVKLNTCDNIYDIVSMLWGKTDTSSTKRDTTASFTVFGRKGLDTIQTLPFYTIDSMQLSPIVAMKLKQTQHFTSPSRRDFSGRMSYFIEPVVLPVIADTSGQNDTMLQEIRVGVNSEPSQKPEFKIYPNPSVNVTTIIGHQLEKGTYTVKVLTETGVLVCTQQLASSSGEDVVFSMDVSTLSTGYYIFTVNSQKGAVGSYPLLIIH